MYVFVVSLVVILLFKQVNCDFNESTTDNSTENEVEEVYLSFGGLYGGSYYNPQASNPKNLHYIHGTYQVPTKNYYSRKHYYYDEKGGTTLDYYLGYGVSKMSDDNFHYENFHWYYHDLNRTIDENDTIPSDFIINCHPNASFLCPENTETVCLRNGTIYCMSKMDSMVLCVNNESVGCVNTSVPCVQACLQNDYNFEEVQLPCLSIVVIEDIYADNKGNTLSRVGGTFIVVKALNQQERTFCVTVIVDPI